MIGCATKQRQIGAISCHRFDVIGHRQAEFQTHLIVIIAVAGGGMHKARACVIGDMIAGKHGDVIVPLAIATFDAAEGVGKGKPSNSSADHIAQRA